MCLSVHQQEGFGMLNREYILAYTRFTSSLLFLSETNQLREVEKIGAGLIWCEGCFLFFFKNHIYLSIKIEKKPLQTSNIADLRLLGWSYGAIVGEKCNHIKYLKPLNGSRTRKNIELEQHTHSILTNVAVQCYGAGVWTPWTFMIRLKLCEVPKISLHPNKPRTLNSIIRNESLFNLFYLIYCGLCFWKPSRTHLILTLCWQTHVLQSALRLCVKTAQRRCSVPAKQVGLPQLESRVIFSVRCRFPHCLQMNSFSPSRVLPRCFLTAPCAFADAQFGRLAAQADEGRWSGRTETSSPKAKTTLWITRGSGQAARHSYALWVGAPSARQDVVNTHTHTQISVT